MAQLLDTQPVSISLYPKAQQLLLFPHTDQLISLVNRAYDERSQEYWTGSRTANIETFVQELGRETFSFVISSLPTEADTSNPTLYGFGSARLFTKDPEASSASIWAYQTPPDEDLTGIERWELKMLAVNPDLQRQGIGDYLLNLLNMEIIRHFRAGQRAGSGKTRCQTVHTTMLECNLAWYEKRGYQVASTRAIAPQEWVIDEAGNSNFKAFNIARCTKFVA